MNNLYKNYPVSITEVYQARRNIYRFLTPTALNYYETLSKITGAEIHIKHENHNPGGSFKIRGGINLMSHLSASGVKGVITFSTGNHGISIATAAQWHGMDAVIVVPKGNNPAKNEAIKNTGAELVEEGDNLEGAAKVIDRLREERHLYSIHPANEPHLINGVGTGFLEIMEDLPDVDIVILPLGADSEIAAGVIVFKHLNPKIKIIAVQAEASQAAYLSWKQKRILNSENKTFAGGFATGSAFELPFNIYKEKLDDFVLLSEDEIKKGIAYSLKHTHNLSEGAGSASLMAAIKIKEKLKGKKVALQMSGCNIDETILKETIGLM